jgi:UDP-N-acetylmuramate--alanine ligase
MNAASYRAGQTRVPLSIGAIHFIGIGGIGMSGIAEVMRNLGYTVQGSDSNENANVKRLRALGIPISVGQRAENLGEAQVVVYSSAVKLDNPELAAARAAGLPIVRRAEMLAELMRLKRCVAIAGTHGKTTTTTMVAALLEAGGLDPTVVNGGIINAYGTNARLGGGDWMVVEADESDGTFLRLPATISIVTNIDPEHLDHYGDFDKVKRAFQAFVENIPFYGFSVMCTDHPEVQAMVSRIRDRRVITYGLNPQADVRAVNVSFSQGASHFDVIFHDRRKASEQSFSGLHLPMPGEHNVTNAVAAIVVARELGVSPDAIRKALKSFGGVKRRFTKVGEWNGASIIDDYGHHPVEIAAVLKAARQAFSGPVVAVVQPHRYTRLRDLFDQFCTCLNEADTAIIAPVYAAGEAPIEGVHRDALVEGLRAHGHKHVLGLDAPEDLPGLIATLAKPGGAIVFLGAGSITNWAAGLEAALKESETRPIVAVPGHKLPKVRGSLVENASLKDLVWFRAGGAADTLFRPADLDDLCAFMAARPKDIPISVIGVGSNLLIREGGIEGVTIRLPSSFGKIEQVGPNRLRVGAAALDSAAARAACDCAIAGLEFLRGIPGTIGGALAMNAGCYGREMKDILVEARAVDARGKLVTFSNAEMGFTYRHSAPKDVIFVDALLEGVAGSPEEIRLRMGAFVAERERTQPVRAKTGGSTFTNPPGHKAWKLIDEAGCRGLKHGAAQVSELHCNFLINAGDATATDIEALGEEVRARVKTQSGVTLEWEIKRVGRPK